MKTRRNALSVTLLMSVLLALFVGVGGAAPDAQANAGWGEVGPGSASGGGLSNTTARSDSPAQAMSPDGSPVVVWDEDRGDGDEIYLRRWNGTAWAEMGGSASGGGISSTPGASNSPAVIVGADGAPIVAWQVIAGVDSEIYVRRWNGSSWAEMGSGSAGGGGVSNNIGNSQLPALALDAGGAPILVWYDASDGDWEIYVRRWNGSAWVEMGSGSATGGGISANSGSSQLPSVAVGPDGTPLIAWQDNSSGNFEIYVRRWNGSAWVEMGSGSATGSGISNNSGNSQRPRAIVTPDNTPIIAWNDDSNGNDEIYLRRWNGSAWVEMGSGSATGGGLSSNSGHSRSPSLAVAASGLPIIAWEDQSNANWEIYARRWNGSSWAEMDSGSAGGGGISNNAGNSYTPGLAVAPGGRVFLSWADRTNGEYEIYARSNPPLDTGECYTLSLTLSGSGSVSASPSQSCYTPGTVVTLTATPGSGSAFSGWSGDISGSANPYALTMNSNKAVTATFAQLPPTCYTLTVTRNNSGGGGLPTTSPGASVGCAAGQYIAGQSISLTAWPNSGWHVGGWTGTTNNGSSATTNTVTMPAAAHTAGVLYQQNAPTCYTLTLTRNDPNGGDIPTADPAASPGCATGQYTAGQLVTLTAWPGGGWRVHSWVGTHDDASKNHVNWVTIPAANYIAGVFYEYDDIEFECYELTLTHVGQGADPTADPESSYCQDGWFEPGDLMNLTAAPAAGWRVGGWSGTNDDSSTAATNLLNMPSGHHEVTVTYEPIAVACYTLTLGRSGSGGNPTASPANSTGCAAGRYTAGQVVALTAAPAAGWRVKSWSGTANNSSTATTNSLTMPAANHSAAVTYEPVPTGSLFFAMLPGVLNIPYSGPTCFMGPSEVEPNNSRAQADSNGPLCGPGEYFGRPNDLWDVYLFITSRSGPISATAANLYGGGMQLTLLDATGASIANDSVAADGLSVSLPNKPAGRYYVAVYTESPKPAETRPYRLVVGFE